MPESTFVIYGDRVPVEVVDAWREHGAGLIDDGYFRMVDPAQVDSMLGDMLPLHGGVVLFVTAMADMVVWWQGGFWVVNSRSQQISPQPVSFDGLVALMADESNDAWDWQPYPQVRDRLGVPAFDDCFMHVPMMAMGGRGDASSMQVGGVWPHIAMMIMVIMSE